MDKSPLSTVNLDDLCDLVVIEDHLIYLTKCFANKASDYAEYMFDLEMKTGEIWAINLLDNVMFQAYPAGRLFFPKSIGYVTTADLIVVTNLAVDGLSLFKRESSDFSLTRIADIDLNAFVFNIHVDVNNNNNDRDDHVIVIWLTIHPIVHKSIEFFNRELNRLPSKLVKLRLEMSKNNDRLVRYTFEEVFKTDGSLLNALGSTLHFNNYLMLFSFVSDPKICSV